LFNAGIAFATRPEIFGGNLLQFKLVGNPTQKYLVPTEQFRGTTEPRSLWAAATALETTDLASLAKLAAADVSLGSSLDNSD
jgi:hypothetical protein